MREQYIQAAKEACSHAHEICYLGSSNRNNGENFNTRFFATIALTQIKSNTSTQVEKIQTNSTLSDDEKNLAIIQLLASIATQSGAGNCQEMAAVAFLFLMEKNIMPIELVSIPAHTFIIIGRNSDTLISDPLSWNTETIICDQWRRKYRSPDSECKESMIYSPSKLVDKLKKHTDATIKVAYAIHPNTTERAVNQMEISTSR